MRKVCPKCSNLADKNDRVCYYCGHHLVGIQEVNLELAKDIQLQQDVEENTLPNKIYRSVIDDDVKINYSKYFINMYLPIGITFLIINFLHYFKISKAFSFNFSYKLILAVVLALSFIILNYIKISSKKKFLFALTLSFIFMFLNFYNLSFIDYMFLEKYLLFPYDLTKNNLNYFFYSFLLFSFISSLIKNKIFYSIFSILALLSILALFFYSKDFKLNKTLIQIIFSNDIYWLLFKISPLVISICMIFIQKDIYFRVILQFFLIIFISINYYFYLNFLNYTALNIILILGNFIGFIINIYLFITLFYGAFLMILKKDNI